MTLVSLRPDSTVSSTGTLTGAASVNAALSDNSDASYVTFTAGQQAVVGIGDLTLPASAVIKNVQMKARISNPAGAGTSATASMTATGGPTQSSISSTPPTLTTYSIGPPAIGWTDAQLDAATLTIKNYASLNGGSVRASELYLDVRYVTIPVVTVTAPTGTLTTTNTPTVTWTDSLDGDGGAQTGFQVKVFTAAQYGIGGFDPASSPNTYDSGVQASSSTSHAITMALANATYRAYVRARQTVNGADHWSAYAFSGFIVSVTPPAVPTFALTTESTQGRIRAVITTGGGATTTDRVELQRSVDGGTTWLAVRNSETDDGTIAYPAAPVTIRDYEAPNGTLASYRARALHNYSGLYAASAWTATSSATWSATSDWWIKDPNKPALNLKLPAGTAGAMFSYADVTRAARRGIFQPVGAALAVSVYDTPASATGTIVVQLRTRAELNVLEALIEEATTLLLQGPVAHDEPDRYVSFGDMGAVRVLDKGWSQVRRVTLPWVEVGSPPNPLSGADWT